MLSVNVQFVPLIRSNLTWCSSNSLNSYIKSVNTVLLNLQNYFQRARPPLRGHQTRFRCTFYHKLPTTVTTAEWERLSTQRWKTNLNDYTTLILVACCSNSLKSHTVIYYVKRRYDPHRVRSWGKSKIVVFEILESTVQFLWIQFLFRLQTKRLPYHPAQRKNIAIYKHKWVLAIVMASNSNLKSSFPVLSPTYPDKNRGVLTK